MLLGMKISDAVLISNTFAATARFSNPSYNRGCHFPKYGNIPSSSSRRRRRAAFVIRNCRAEEGSGSSDSERVSPYQVLGIDPSLCTLADIKAAFRARVKEFHPDVNKDAGGSNVMIRRVIQAYEILSMHHQFETAERKCADPFEDPECEALDLFVNEALCVGKGCPYSCVKRAPHAFAFDSPYGTACAISQGHGEDYQVQLAVGQCPRSCIHYVTPSQRVILEELLDSVLNSLYSSAEAAVLDSLIAKARFENNRYQKPKKRSKASTEYVDWL
ncbi:uncharacterized protein LOC131226041 isoform X1 [Magnolia sinica]|uniref:uncharacterized protein LOC131226041 isoform X1 n=1 Tax=Magnolia sinica TaxID=86752 RepID=UPI002658213A|nr:uncharacterized protein LOC131226041 isoform X1 [Magnolia sinica]